MAVEGKFGDTYFIGTHEYTKCCSYRVIEVKNKSGKKERICHQCLKKLKDKDDMPPYKCPSQETECGWPKCGCEWRI